MENIFAQIEEAYRYSTPFKKEKALKEEAIFQTEKELSIMEFKKLYNGLAPYFGTFYYNDIIRVIGDRRTDLLNMNFVESYIPGHFWFSTEDNIKEMQAKGLKFVRGTNRSGQVVWTSDVGLVFKLHPKVFHGFELVDGWRLPTIDWVVSSLKAMEFLHWVPKLDSWTNFISEENLKLKQEEERKAAGEKFNISLEKEMREGGYVVNNITKQLYMFFKHFDHYYDFSDDGHYVRKYSAKEKLAKKLAEEHDPKLLKLLEKVES